jgi:hypothetical protein
VVVAHSVTIRLALNGTFRLNCQHNFNFWAAGGQKFTSLSTLLGVRYVPSLYRATTRLNFGLREASTAVYEEEKTHLQPIIVNCQPWPLATGFQQQK